MEVAWLGLTWDAGERTSGFWCCKRKEGVGSLTGSELGEVVDFIIVCIPVVTSHFDAERGLFPIRYGIVQGTAEV